MKSSCRQDGFTLVEILVSISILILFSAGFSSVSKINRESKILRYEVDNVSELAARTRTYAMSGKLKNADSDASHGYGLFFDNANPNKVIVYSDDNDSHNFDADEELAGESLILNPQVNFSVAVSLDVFFRRYDGQVFVNSSIPAARVDYQIKLFLLSDNNKFEWLELNLLTGDFN